MIEMTSPTGRGGWGSRVAAVAAGAALMVAVGGCGAGITATTARTVEPLALAACMRAKGLPDFPDPNSTGRLEIEVTRSQVQVDGVTLRETPQQFRAADQTCLNSSASPGAASAAPNPQLRQEGDAFAACMRSHGIGNFPDPQVTASGLHMQIPPGTNPKVVQTAQRACAALLRAPTGSKTAGGAADRGAG